MADFHRIHALCPATIDRQIASTAPHFLNPYAILLGFIPGIDRGFSALRAVDWDRRHG
jgi:hypothetical protein